jgi:hypothetical protein
VRNDNKKNGRTARAREGTGKRVKTKIGQEMSRTGQEDYDKNKIHAKKAVIRRFNIRG